MIMPWFGLYVKNFLKKFIGNDGAGIGRGKGSPDRQLANNSEHQHSLIRTQRRNRPIRMDITRHG